MSTTKKYVIMSNPTPVKCLPNPPNKGEAVLEIVHNKICDVCHNQKDIGLMFHYGRHAYCDFHCKVSVASS